MKKIILIFAVLLMTGCVEVTTVPENRCYRYVDYKMEEYYIDYDDNFCGSSSGMMRCRDNKKTIQVVEFEIVACPVKEEK